MSRFSPRTAVIELGTSLIFSLRLSAVTVTVSSLPTSAAVFVAAFVGAAGSVGAVCCANTCDVGRPAASSTPKMNDGGAVRIKRNALFGFVLANDRESVNVLFCIVKPLMVL